VKTKIFLSAIFLLLLTSLFATAANRPTTVYKTKMNYNDLVPVGLSEDKLKIWSHPDPKHLQSAYPTKLHRGYLLDNRGVGKNSAFLNITYQKYSQLSNNIITLQMLFDNIIDNDPFLEMYNCGDRYRFKDEVKELNQIIDQNKLEESCTVLLKNTEQKQTQLNKNYWFIGASIVILLSTLLIILKKKM